MNLSRADIRRIGHATAAAILAASDSESFGRIVVAVARALQAEAPPPTPEVRRNGVLANMPEDKLAGLRARFEAGENVSALARESGILKNTIFSHAERHGWTRPPARPTPTPEERRAQKAAYNARYRQRKKGSRAAPAAQAPAPAPAPAPMPAPVLEAPPPPPVTPPPAPRPAPPVQPLEPITCTAKQVRQWLAQSMYVGGVARRDAEDRVARMTHEEALEEANGRRARLREAPFRLIFARSGR